MNSVLLLCFLWTANIDDIGTHPTLYENNYKVVTPYIPYEDCVDKPRDGKRRGFFITARSSTNESGPSRISYWMPDYPIILGINETNNEN